MCRLTKINLGSSSPSQDVGACVHMVHTWLPHVHTLKCSYDALALAHGLGAQLQHLSIVDESQPSQLPAAAPMLQQLVSLEVWFLSHTVLDVLMTLPNVFDVQRPPAGQWGVKNLALGHCNLPDLTSLPLNGMQRLEFSHPPIFRLQPSPAASGASMREACSHLARVLQVKLSGLRFLHKARDGGVLVPPEQCDPQHWPGCSPWLAGCLLA